MPEAHPVGGWRGRLRGAQPPGGGSRGAVLLTAALMVVANLPFFLMGALAVQIRSSLGFDRQALGAAVAVLLAAAGVLSPVLGRIAQRAGASRSLAAAALLNVVAGVGIAGTAVSWVTLAPWLALAGTALALTESGGNLLLAQRVQPGRMGLAFGVKQAAPPAASLAAGIALPVVALTVGWRWAFAGAAALALAGAFWAVSIGGRGEAASQGAPARRRTRRRGVLVLSLGAACGFGAATSLATFLVDGAVTVGITESWAGLLLAAAAIVSVTVRLASGALADRWRRDHLTAVAAIMAVGGAGYALLGSGRPGLLVPGAILAYGLGHGWSGLFFYSVALRNPEAVGTASGAVLRGAFLGSLVNPLVFGALVERFGYSSGWLFTGALVLVGAVAVMLGSRLAPISAASGTGVPSPARQR